MNSNYSVMSALYNEFVSLRYGTFKNVCNILSIDYYRSLDHIDDINYICFHIVKRQDNKIICMSPQSSIFDISQFHPLQITNMKIHYKSFNKEFNFNPISNNMITLEYISELRVVIKNIILEIIHNLNTFDYKEIHVYEDKIPNIIQFIKNNDNDSFEGYFCKNVRYYIDKVEESQNKIQRIKLTNSLFNFVNYNLEYIDIPEYHKFATVFMKKVIEIKKNVKDELCNIFNADHIVYDDVIICINILDSITKFTHNFMCKFNNIYREVTQTC